MGLYQKRLDEKEEVVQKQREALYWKIKNKKEK